MDKISDCILFIKPLMVNLGTILHELENKNVLILGAGNGELANHLCNYKAYVFAIDIKTSESWAKHKKVNYFCASNEYLPFNNNQFDVIISCSTFQYVNHDMVFNEIYRVAKCGAYVLLNENMPKNPIIALFRVKRRLVSLLDKRVKNHLCSMTSYLSPEAIKRNGLSIEQYERYYLLEVVNYYLLNYKNTLISNKISRYIGALDKTILNTFKFLKKYCWFCTYRIKVNKKHPQN